jgi:RHS repeat-associated protein
MHAITHGALSPMEAPMSRLLTLALTTLLAAIVIPAAANAQGSEDVRYYHTDAAGSVRLVTDANGQVVERYDYLPFGEPWTASPTGTETRRFGAKERDTETGLDYFGGRYHAGANGRFTTVDPLLDIDKALAEPQLWNRYAYVTNNPFRYLDPDGKQREAALDRDVYALLNKQITVEEYNARIQARGVGGAVGALIVAGPIGWRVAVGCFLSPSCQSGTINLLEGAAGGAPTQLNPGRLLPALTSTTRAALLEAAVAEGRGGVSEAGRALQSHAARAGSWLAGLAQGGNGPANTAAARKVLAEVLESGEVSRSTHKVWGNIISVRLKDGRGAVWTADGDFITFLERYSAQ